MILEFEHCTGMWLIRDHRNLLCTFEILFKSIVEVCLVNFTNKIGVNKLFEDNYVHLVPLKIKFYVRSLQIQM